MSASIKADVRPMTLRLDHIAQEIRSGTLAARELHEGAEYIMTAAKLDTPVDTGALRQSGRVDYGVTTAFFATATLSFNTPYAIYVHENLQAHHPVGHAKFLERAVASNVAFLNRQLAEAVKRAMGGK